MIATAFGNGFRAVPSEVFFWEECEPLGKFLLAAVVLFASDDPPGLFGGHSALDSLQVLQLDRFLAIPLARPLLLACHGRSSGWMTY